MLVSDLKLRLAIGWSFELDVNKKYSATTWVALYLVKRCVYVSCRRTTTTPPALTSSTSCKGPYIKDVRTKGGRGLAQKQT